MQDVEARPGMYFLRRGERVVYVGQAVNCKRRVGVHRTRLSPAFGKWDNAKMIPSPFETERKDMEAEYIAEHRPELNTNRQHI